MSPRLFPIVEKFIFEAYYKPTLYLKNPTKEDTLIYRLYCFDCSKLKYATRQKINPEFWNTETQRARESRVFTGYVEFNIIRARREVPKYDLRKMRTNHHPYSTSFLCYECLPPERVNQLNNKNHRP